MIGATKRRFWAEVRTERTDAGYRVLLDGRPVRTPAKAALVLPSAALAEVVAGEWEAQEGEIAPAGMHFTRAANSAIDKVAPQRDAVAEMLAEYGGSDLICYRAEAPAGLAARQAKAWDPWLNWSAEALGAPLVAVAGVVHQSQPSGSLARLAGAVAAHETFELTALHDLVTLSGSLVLGLAVSRGALEAPEAWALSRIDETWQEEQWGRDNEAAAEAKARSDAFARAARLLEMLREPGA